jgi:hypothetical protein
MARKFERKFENIDNLLKSDFWKTCLKEDCENQNVFLAVRNNDIGFYHKGGRLFEFDEKGEFKTNIKYAAVIEKTIKRDYITENELKNSTLISDFSSNYTRIKENCALYSGDEAQGVSKMYHKHSYLSSKDIVVLDIEISFEAIRKEKGQKQDRIDILLFDTKKRKLKFVEAKHFSNKEIWSNNIPEVIEQIKRYNTQIATKKSEIKEAYEQYVNAINEIFGIFLPLPEDVEAKVTLLIFGFDQNQKDGRLTKLVLDNPAYKTENINVYAIGNIDNIDDLEKLWTINRLKKL